MYYIGLDVHKKTISYCVKDAAGKIHSEGKIGSTRHELDAWIKTLPQPRMIAMEATIFTGWLDLRSPASARREDQGSPPTVAAHHCRGEAEERQDRCQQEFTQSCAFGDGGPGGILDRLASWLCAGRSAIG